MAVTVTLQIPDPIYQRLVNTANATGRSLEVFMLQALKIGTSYGNGELDVQIYSFTKKAGNLRF
jgi:hypothetical protein